ncbi:MAG: chemotaxis protein CheW [Campylobacterales bacterium]
MQNAEHAAAGSNERFLTFYLGEEAYGVSIMAVKEIIALMKTTRVPKSPPYLRGVMNLRGIIIPVVDMRTRFGMAPVEATMHTAIIIVRIGNDNIGFVVDQVEEVCTATADQMSEPPTFGTEIDAGYIQKMIRTEKEVIMILDLEHIFSEDELAELERTAKTA